MSAPIVINGRLGADPEYKVSSSGVPLCNLRIVTNRRRKNGEAWEDYDTTWWPVTCFKAQAETAATLVKGQRVILTGWARERSWETAQGEKRSRIEVVADEIAGIQKAAPTQAAPTSADDPWSSDAPF